MTGGSSSGDNTTSNPTSDLIKDLFGTKPTNRDSSRESNREPNREPRTDKPGPPTEENWRLTERITRLELSIGAANHTNPDLKDRIQHQIDDIRNLTAELKTEKNRTKNVDAQLPAAARDLARYRARERETTATDSFHEDLKREAADINATALRNINDAIDCISQGGLGHVADGIFRLKDALSKWRDAKGESLRRAEEKLKGLAALTQEVQKTTKRARDAVDPKEKAESPKKARIDPHSGTPVKQHLPKPVKTKPAAILAIPAEPRVTSPPKQQPLVRGPLLPLADELTPPPPPEDPSVRCKTPGPSDEELDSEIA
jgi:hypothetical protein